MEQPACNTPMVTIRCLVYNHEQYLRQCLDGFVMQQTNFPFEAIVHDDASTDGSAAIIREYAEKYPDIIKPIYETENQYSKRNGSIRRIMIANTHGKYVALCEGDDYWTDPLKLQKQVDFLESNPEYTMCFANAIMHYENNTAKEDRIFSNVEDRDYTGVELRTKWIVPTASVMLRGWIYKSDMYTSCSQNKNFFYGDIVLWLTCAHYGKIRGMSDIVSVYRRHDGGMTFVTNKSYEKRRRYCTHSLEIYKVFGKEYRRHSEKVFFRASMSAFLHALSDKKKDIAKDFIKASLNLSVFGTINAFFYTIKEQFKLRFCKKI